MGNNKEKYWAAEIIWWLITLIITILILIPISVHEINFKFIFYNIFFIILGITFTRYIFLFNNHPLAYSKVFKILLIFIVPILFFPILEGLHSFIEFNDREGIQTVVTHLSNEDQIWLIRYIRIEYLFFGTMSLLGSFLLIIKMIRVFKRQFKYGKI